ncbi:MAG: DUF2500 domain-containing protein [Lachnospiraceae bacterium]|nr:DUF2500 domain-containing protein [Lachnospiraceae bacterium]
MNDFFFFDFIFPEIFTIVFIFVVVFILGTFIFAFIKGIGEWNKNNHSPRLTVPATVITKRSHTSHSHSHNDSNIHHSSTSYYATFQFESGDRSEFLVSGQEYGMLSEGDMGNLTFQGTRYLSFTRTY